MRIGAFELIEPVPKLKDPCALVMLAPWIDVGGAGRSVMSILEAHLDARELGKLSRPGAFYDFTRYRPMVYTVEDRREIKIPNTFINYAHREQGNDLLFFHSLEPHAHSETYIESFLKVLERLGVKRHCRIGGMYDSVPHTRPLLVSGNATERELDAELKRLNVYQGSSYQGPTSITSLIAQQAIERGIETMSLMVRLPSYAQLDEDYSGQYVLLNLLCYLFDFSMDLSEIKRKGDEQYRRISAYIEGNPQMKEVVQAIETQYDTGLGRREASEPMPRLSREVEEFLRGINESFDSD